MTGFTPLEHLEVKAPFPRAWLALAAALAVCAHAQVETVPGMPPVPDPNNLYSETGADKLSQAVEGHLERIYVPHVTSNDVYVIDPHTFEVVDRFRVGLNPQHVVPSWDLQTLWVTNNAEGTTKGTLTPIDPRTGKPGKPVAVDDPYNMYFTPDGKSAIVVAEALKRLDFRDAHTMALIKSVPGNVSLESMLTEIAKLDAVRAAGLPDAAKASSHRPQATLVTQPKIAAPCEDGPGDTAERPFGFGRDGQPADPGVAPDRRQCAPLP